jgi:aspartyl-tRNA(Asn)/glutamyl-tRNA(Gln) amidotransferase subunit B
LSEFDTGQLTQEPGRAALFEATVAAGAPAKAAANWIIGNTPTLDAEQLAELIILVAQGVINREQGVKVLEEAQASGRPPRQVVSDLGLAQVSDEAQLRAVVERVIGENPRAVADYRSGKQQAIGALLAGVKEATAGSANMGLASRIIRELLIQ